MEYSRIVHSFITLLISLQFDIFKSLNHSKNLLLPPPDSYSHRPAMMIPLFIIPHTQLHSPVTSGRHLHTSESIHIRPNARMRLYDDLLLNGYYTTRLWIGTPPQSFALIVDTGSTVTYVPCSTCEQCGNHQDPKFQSDLSSTYQPVKCNADCSCDNNRGQCVYERHYAEMSSSSGVLGEDVISFGNESELVPQRAVFGCENVETGDLYSQHADGIMGLGRGDLSVVDQLVAKGVISDSFSLCYGGMDIGGGAMVLGGFSPPADMVFTHSDPSRSQYYNIELNEIHVAGKRLDLNTSVFDGKHGTVLDSGTTYAYLPEAAFVALKDAIMKELQFFKQIRGPDPNYNDICFSGAGSDASGLSKTFPAVDMVFSNGQKLLLSPENYLFRHSKADGAYCLGIFQNEKDPTTLLGGIIVRNTLVSYDREHEKIGFWKTNCSELWERLHISGVTSDPSDFSKNNSTGVQPALIPKESPHDDILGKLHVGFISLEIFLNIKYSYLRSRISEFTGLIALDLDVNASQVHLLDSMPKGNNSLIKLAIYPAEPAAYMSNATAMEIIARLAEHRVQFPGTFGIYQLLEWKLEPPSKRTWWTRHYMASIMGFMGTLVIGLAACVIWLIWKRTHQNATWYKPVGTATPEQELQPL